MFRSLTRIPLRRCLHTIPPRPPPSQGNNFPLVFGIGAMVAAVTYMSGSSNQRIALDAPQLSASQQLSVPPTSISDAPPETLSTEMPQSQTPEPSSSLTAPPSNDDPISEDAEPVDDESSGGAFNPVTGEINWDCPCLGGMAHGPCGPQFREAFSCFVFSEKEPKGIDCVEKFKGMQDCFREHPDVYGEEIMDDDEEEGMDAPDSDGKPAESQEGAVPAGEKTLDILPQTVP